MDWSSHSETQEDPIQKNKPTFDKDETELVVCIDLKC